MQVEALDLTQSEILSSDKAGVTSMAVLNASGRTAPDPRDVSTFSGAPQRIVIDGPASLYRLLGVWRDRTTGKKARSNPNGAFWFTQTVIDVLKEDFRDAALSGERKRNPAQTILKNVREDLAVSYEWNSFDSLVKMDVPSGFSIETWSGITNWQLEYQGNPTGRLLSGGLVQYVIYDVGQLPATLLNQRPLTQLWMQFSRQLPV